ncbi:MAG: SelB C-terminal domain-containing protein, partial [Acidimicrobiia bacterium]|nr:SelB C-terminal domain-containing protein [Acidimicrobiia bacterium]
PQTEEHFAVLDLLEIDRCVVALTRVDLADSDTTELAELEVIERLEGTALEGSPLIRVAAPTGQGMDDLRDALVVMVAKSQVPDFGRPRLWVDRSFAISGAGTVVTGTLVGGPLSVGDELTVWPGQHSVRVRSLQSHEASIATLAPGNRAAANLVGIEVSEIPRGAMLGVQSQWLETDRLLVDMRTVRSLGKPLKDRGAYHFHVGSGSVPAHVRLLESDALDGTGAALISLSSGVPLAMGDRFILREVGRRAVVAGGRVLDPNPRKTGAALRQTLPKLRGVVAAPPAERATVLLKIREREDAVTLAAHTGGGGATAAGEATDPKALARMGAAGLELVAEYHARFPLRPGMPKAELATKLDVDVDQLDAIVGAGDGLVSVESSVAAAEFEGGWGPEQQKEWNLARSQLLASGLAVPRASQLALGTETFHALERRGDLISVSEDLVYLPEQVEEIVTGLARLDGEFTVADFRDAMHISRRQAIPLLEWLDRRGITARDGDVRSVRSSGETESDDAPLR